MKSPCPLSLSSDSVRSCSVANRSRGVEYVLRSALFVLAFFLSVAVPQARADGLIINPTFNDASFTAAGFNLTDVHNAFNFAATEFESLFTDPIHVNINVAAGGTGLGSSSADGVYYFSYAAMRQTLINDNTAHPSTDGSISVATLGTTDPTNGGFL